MTLIVPTDYTPPLGNAIAFDMGTPGYVVPPGNAVPFNFYIIINAVRNRPLTPYKYRDLPKHYSGWYRSSRSR